MKNSIHIEPSREPFSNKRLIISIIVIALAAAMLIGFAIWMKRSAGMEQKSEVEEVRDTALLQLEIHSDYEFDCDKKHTCVINIMEAGDNFAAAAKVKYHGDYSMRYPKHSFSIEFTKPQTLGDLPMDDDYILNADYIDKTLMRHKLAYDLFREMNPKKNVAPQTTYTLLTVNGEAQGIYLLTQKVTAKVAGLKKKNAGAMLFKEPPIFYEQRIKAPKDSANYYMQRFPKLKDRDCAATMDSLHDFLFHSSDAKFAKEVTQWFDLDNVIDWHLLLLFTNNQDGYMKNFYLYRTKMGEPFRFIPWDYDHSFGRDGDGEKNLLERVIQCERCILLRRLMESTELGYNEKLRARYAELRKSGVLSVEHFCALITANERVIAPYLAENFGLWPVDAKDYFDGSTHAAEIALMKTFVAERLAQLDADFGLKK